MKTAPIALEEFANLLKLRTDLPPAKVQSNVQFRLAAIGAGSICSRCGGCGQYSFNGSHSICYKCNGVGKVVRKLDARAYADAKQAVESGELEKYLDYKRASQHLKTYSQELYFSAIGTGSPGKLIYADGRADLTDSWTVFNTSGFQPVHKAASEAYKALNSCLSASLSLAERRERLAAFLPLWATFVQTRLDWMKQAVSHPGRAFHWQSNADTVLACANGDELAYVHAMDAYEKERAEAIRLTGKGPDSVPYQRTERI